MKKSTCIYHAKYLSVVLCVFFINALFAQQNIQSQTIFINNETQSSIDYWQIKQPSLSFHSSFQPYLSSSITNSVDSIIPYTHFKIKSSSLSKILNEGPSKRNQYTLKVLPIIDLNSGYDLLTQKIISQTFGGAHAQININDNFTLSFNAIGGRVSFPNFIDTIVQTSALIPGLGRAYKNSAGSYDFANLTGYLSYSPNKVFNFQLGKDKHFIGDGYRSLLLSDLSNNNPYVGINTTIWRIQYNVWYSWMKDFTRFDGTNKSLQNKFGTFHYLSFNASKNFNISFFENVVWQGTDTNRVRTFDINYLNPVVFYRPQEYSVGSADNSMIGVNMSGILFNKLKLYGQFVADEFFLKEIRAKRGWWANKQGWQLGAKYINAFNIKGLSLQAEYNEVRPYTYTHGSPQQNYANYGQALAHPLGANFKEYLGFINFRFKNWAFQLQGISSVVGIDTLKSNLGQNIFLSYTTRPFEYGHKTTQGNKTHLLQSDIKITYFLIPQLNLRAEIGYIQRSVKDDLGYELQSPYFYFGIKSSIHRFYKDY